MIDRFIYR